MITTRAKMKLTPKQQRLSDNDRAKPIVKRMIADGRTVAEIKAALAQRHIQSSAYDRLVSQGIVEQYRDEFKQYGTTSRAPKLKDY